ncbi:MAG: signal peptidase II [Crocinitomicaceae bacterium]|nr:signal peptidase II [Crocinitomicaceae bacterium]
MRKNIAIVGIIVALILILDQCLKIWVKTTFDNEPINLLGEWFRMVYVENPGMAFGTTFGGGIWGKLALSLFRIAAIVGLAYYWMKQSKAGAKLEFLIVIGLIFAGALGNLIDSMFYDYIFVYEPCYSYNLHEGSGIWSDCGTFWGKVETRQTGFLFGNVVDMFQFNVYWPSWVPWLGGKAIFPAVWNIADFSISSGVILILFRQKHYFAKESENKDQA